MSMRSLYHDERLKMTMPQACYYCASTDSLAVDHLIPRIKGGPSPCSRAVGAGISVGSPESATWRA